MEAYLNVVSAVFAVAFVAWLLRELVLSRKSKESVPVAEQMCMAVEIRLVPNETAVCMLVYGDLLEDMQKRLNVISFSSIQTARVYYKGQVVYVMNKAGVLVAV